MHDIFFFTDIHGMYDLYRAIMDFCNEQDSEAMIIFGGDAMDRGRDGYKIMKELLDNPKVVYLMGNHEDLFVKAAREIKEKFEFHDMERKEVRDTLYWTRSYDNKFINIQNVLYNGGIETLTDWVMDGMPMDIIEKVENLPRTFSTDTCDFCHAAGVYETFKKVADAEYKDEKPDSYSAESVIWTRSAFNYGWAPNRTAIFGHTPTPCLYEFMNVPIDMTDPYRWIGTFDKNKTGAKIDMDTGACFTGVAHVLNVLTMQAYGFEDIDVNTIEIRKHDIKKIGWISVLD